MTRQRLLNFKAALFKAWGLNLYQPDATAPLPRWVWRKIGAE